MTDMDWPTLTIDVTEDDHAAHVSIEHGFFHGWHRNGPYPRIEGKEFYDDAHRAAYTKATEARAEVDAAQRAEIKAVIFTWNGGAHYQLQRA